MTDSFFPSNRAEALALLYLQSADLSSSSPEEIQAKYFDALGRIKSDYRTRRSEYLAALNADPC